MADLRVGQNELLQIMKAGQNSAAATTIHLLWRVANGIESLAARMPNYAEAVGAQLDDVMTRLQLQIDELHMMRRWMLDGKTPPARLVAPQDQGSDSQEPARAEAEAARESRA